MSRKWLWGGLFVSLALNVFVLGAFAGMALTRLRPEPPPREAPQPRSPMQAAVAALPAEHREAWRSTMRAQGGAAQAKFRESRRLRREAWTALGADPVDVETVRARLERARTLEQEGRAGLDAKIVDFAAGLPPAERARFAEALLKPRGDRDGSGRRAPPREGRPGLPDR